MNLFELFAKISLDSSGYEKGLADASEETSTFAAKLQSGLKTAAKIGGAALTAAAGGIAALTKSAVTEYADYEQLVGGVETLFKQSQDIVMGYAENAYKTAGLSANDYMETVTSFSASLLQSLGGDTEKAAQQADKAITDMSDNANKMGTSMESIQNAYQGFAKQNYTMLDNLKLGYGGTKEEMERLLKDAEKLSGMKFDISSYSDIVDAIHIVQTEMGVTGTTALEASTTIQGSLGSLKAAWGNLVTGIADGNANMGTLIANFVDSASTAAANLVPRVEQAIQGISTLISSAATTIVPMVITTLTSQLPNLINAGIDLVRSIAQGIMDNLPALAESAMEIILQLSNSIAEDLPTMIPTIVDIVLQIVETLIDNVDALVDASLAIMTALAEGLVNALPKLIEKGPVIIQKVIQAIVNNAPKLIEASIQIMLTIAEGLITNIPKVISAIPSIVEAIVLGFGNLMGSILNIGVNIVKGVWQGIKNMAGWIKEKVTGFFKGIVDGVKGFLGIKSPSRVFSGIGKYMAEGLGNGWDSEYSKVKRDIESGLDFGTGSVDFQASAVGKSSAGIINSVMQTAQSGGGDYTINVNIDGETAATVLWNPLKSVSRQRGEAFA
nr:MAG TPA: tail tape measure protein [Caudoviricetes sp.]